jgi:hypothetical protein
MNETPPFEVNGNDIELLSRTIASYEEEIKQLRVVAAISYDCFSKILYEERNDVSKEEGNVFMQSNLLE